MSCHKYKIEWKENKPDTITPCLRPDEAERAIRKLAKKKGLRPAFTERLLTAEEKKVEREASEARSKKARRKQRLKDAGINTGLVVTIVAFGAGLYWLAGRAG